MKRLDLLFSVCFMMVFLTTGSIAQATVAKKDSSRSAASRSLLPDLDALNCRGLVEADIQEAGIGGTWVEQAPKVSGGRAFRAPTQALGTWLELVVDKNAGPKLYTVTGLATRERVWASDCTSTSVVLPGLSSVLSKDADTSMSAYDDAALQKVLSKNDSGVIYVWSPGMSFSAMMLKTYRAWAKSKKLQFVVVADPRTNVRDVLRAEQSYGFSWDRNRLSSVELYMRNTTIHFPTALVFKQGRIHRSEIVGVMSSRDFQTEVTKRLAEL